ncbi:hypothetical protein [Streptomyces lancefieldiae]|uniref:Uncharacterized protein n=1 Tax=Streptomyces lancefieldiae TaxID=3075520 RepID=A0ABU3AR34_9ACTN|nr:hypothetical protein [Streptomyces sp. DSM 40712]MDT0612634.1 hypothetical protein [Streptomyces sp. DSM 40712]
MGFEGETWHVCGVPDPGQDGEDGAGTGGTRETGEIGEILIDDADFPWLSGRFRAGPAYGAVQDLFARELALAERDDAGHWAEWERVYAEIGHRVRLVSPDGPVAEFLLHIKGDRAWFRWSDEPFGREPADG